MATGGNLNTPVTELDFFEIKENLKTYLRGQNQFKDYDFDGAALSVLLDVLAYNTHYSGFYANMVANEMFLDSAVTRNAVVSRAKELGHTPSSTKASRAEVHITYDEAEPSFLPVGTIFSATNENNDSYNFINTDVITIAATGGSGGVLAGATASIYQGSYRTNSFLFDNVAESSPKFIIPSNSVDTSQLHIRVSNSSTDSTGYYTPWDLSSNYTGLTSGSEVYFLQEVEDGRYEVYFGDGIVGKKPSHGNIVTVSYLETEGFLANNIGKYDVRNSRRSFSIGDANATVDVTSYAQGGGSPETITSIKYYAPRSYQAQDRAVTAEDYKTLVATQYGDVESVYVYGGEDAIPPLYGKVFISIKPNSGESLTDTEKESIKTTILKGNNIVSILPEIIDPEYLYITVDSTITFDPSKTIMNAETLKTAVNLDVLNYSDSKLEKFGNNFYYSKLCSRIDRLDDSIVGNETKIKLQRKLEPTIGSAAGYIINFYNEIYHPHDGHVEGVVSSSKFKYKDSNGISVDSYILDDGNGNLNIYTTSTDGIRIKIIKIGTVDYINGSINLVSFNPVQDDSSVSIIFKVEPKDLNIISSRNILLIIDSVNIKLKEVGKESVVGTTNTTIANESTSSGY
jgi:hypothetical protein